MRTLICAVFFIAGLSAEEKVDLYTINRIKNEAYQNSKVMENAFYLTDVYGPRLTGSPGIQAAAGCAVTMEAIRILKTLDLPMPRTVRIALRTGEKQGLL